MTEVAKLQKLSLEDKVSLLAGASYWRTRSFPQHQIKAIKFSDGPNGVRGQNIHASTKTYCFPCGACVGATFNADLAFEMGKALGDECRLKNVGVILGPTVNLHRSPLGGRNFEAYSEDPTLSGILGAGYVNGVQSQNVAACAKHFVGNECEKERQRSSTNVDEKTLRELYAYPFQLMMKRSNPWTVMSAYNKVNGTYMSEHTKLLQGVLREEWGFGGAIISDFEGVYNTVPPVLAGCDVEMPGPPKHRAAKLLQAVQDGQVAESQIDLLCSRVIKLADKIGMDDETLPEQVPSNPATDKLVRQIASEGIVLLKNERGVLPVRPSNHPRIAIFGNPAATPVIFGGGSASVTPTRVSAPLKALQDTFGEANVTYNPGVAVFRKIPSAPLEMMKRESNGEPGVDCYWYNGSVFGQNLVHEERLETTRTLLIEPRIKALEQQHCSQMRYILTPKTTGLHTFGLTACGATEIKVDGRVVVSHAGFTDVKTDYIMRPADFENRGDVEMVGGQEYHIEINTFSTTAPPPSTIFRVTPQATQVGFYENLNAPLGKEVADLASSSDVSIVFTANNKEFESESFDRETLSLTSLQNDLITAVSKSARKTIVVNMTGAPITMPWLEDVSAVLQCWFAGQEVGTALADIISGATSPSGKLPVTFPMRIEDTPSYGNFPIDNNLQIHYAEGLNMGYRARGPDRPKPLFPFGFGLSYTTFATSDLSISSSTSNHNLQSITSAEDLNLTATYTISNTGSIPGKEVVQIYVDGILKAFRKISLEVDETKSGNDVAIEMDKYAFSEWDVDAQNWVVRARKYVVEIRTHADQVACGTEVVFQREMRWTGL